MTLLLRPTVDDSIAVGGTYGYDRGLNHVPRFHQGIDIPVDAGTPLYASGTGVVIGVGNTGRVSGFGLYVKVRYAGEDVLIAHLSSTEVNVGEPVNVTTQLGLSGGEPGSYGAGGSQGEHVHVERYKAGTRVDPTYLVSRSSVAGSRIIIQEEEEMSINMQACHYQGNGLYYIYGPGLASCTSSRDDVNAWLKGQGAKLDTALIEIESSPGDNLMRKILQFSAGVPVDYGLRPGETWSAAQHFAK